MVSLSNQAAVNINKLLGFIFLARQNKERGFHPSQFCHSRESGNPEDTGCLVGDASL